MVRREASALAWLVVAIAAGCTSDRAPRDAPCRYNSECEDALVCTTTESGQDIAAPPPEVLEVDRAVREAITACLAADPTQRPTAAALLAALS